MTDKPLPVEVRITLRNIHEVLRQKTQERDQLNKQIEALQIVAPLLEERQEQRHEFPPPIATAGVIGTEVEKELPKRWP